MRVRKEGEREIKRGRERKRDSEKEGERDTSWLLYFYFFKGMTGALAPFSYLV